jgi:23S rRNA (guanine745-N1)-methyltransferase
MKCAAGHTISIAREGHVFLRATGRKKKESGAAAGDDLAMVRARRAFFDAGHYGSVARAVAKAVLAATASDSPPQCRAVLDAGCGEGRYLGFVGEEAETAGVDIALTGIDVSKHAVAVAAKRYGRTARFAVASSYALPFDADAFDAVMCVFSPLAVSEFVRVAKPGGALVVATSGPGHLMGLKELLYEEARVYTPRLEALEAVGHVEQVVHVRERLCVEGNDAKSLLAMTPFWWTAKPEHQEAVADVPLDTFIDVEVRVIRLP